ncbi:MAG: type II CRISPR RNA-guided endonuclease Cas9 [Bacteroides sp.]|nr:type II CRISPR RNA-guided endonuclease Cas9 [Bacteroides sp.]
MCEFEGFRTQRNNKEYFVGPKVAPKSSPLFQMAKIWESINNLKIESNKGESYSLSLEQKKALFYHLDNNEKLTTNDLFKILGINKKEYTVGKQLEKGIQGNITKAAIKKCFNGNTAYNNYLQFNVNVINTDKITYCYGRKNGEIKGEKSVKYVDPCVEKEPLYQLWHVIYSINDSKECISTLIRKFQIDEETAEKLAQIDFTRFEFGNKSAKSMRKILPYLMEGDIYSNAMSYAGYNHSNSQTKEERFNQKLEDKLRPVEKKSLRQPIVEKILNQMVNVVNAIIDKYGKPDEIRVELARELKQSKEERNNTDKAMSKRQRENEEIIKSLQEYGLRATRNNILKWRLYEEMDNHEKKLNAICIYCGQPISLTEAIRGNEVDIEHIIPKSKLFDDSQSNKTLAHRKCNSTKDNMTAYDFMASKSPQQLEAYLERINSLYTNKIISKTKRDKLLMTESEIPDDFIDRQLRESQYIAKKAREILQTICHEVWCTSGNVTAELRHLWGWDDVTMNLQFRKYKELGLTEMVEWESEHGKNKHTKEVISGWSKRDDHRHHAIDALVIACTKQGYIQKFNNLSSSTTREEMERAIMDCSQKFREKRSLLERYIIAQCPFNVVEVEQAAANILISFKAGKKVATKGNRKTGKRGNRKVVQTNIIVPRGSLSEESVYGRIKTIEKEKPLKYLFENPYLIFNSFIKQLITERLLQCNNDVKKATASIKKEPIYLNKEKTEVLEYASCFKEEYVIKYRVDTNFNKTSKVIDGRIRKILENRLNKFGGKHKEAFKDIQSGDKTIKWYEDEGLKHPIHSVRCYTGLSAIVPVRKDHQGKEIGFVKPGNNHHVAIYTNPEGGKIEHICTFWHAVERKKYGIPVVIENSNEVWDFILSQPENSFSESFFEKLPPANVTLELSLQQNEALILDMNQDDIKVAIKNKNYKALSEKLYRVQSITSNDYYFRHHLETQIINDNNARLSKRFYRIKSVKSLLALSPYKIRLNCLGEIQTG